MHYDYAGWIDRRRSNVTDRRERLVVELGYVETLYDVK